MRFLRKTFRILSLQIGLASPVLMKFLFRGKWESVPKGPIVSFSIRGEGDKNPSLDNGVKMMYSVVMLIAMGLSAALGVVSM